MSEKYWQTEAYYDGHVSQFNLPWWAERYPNFTAGEFTSYRGEVLLLSKGLDALQAIRTELGLPLFVNSAYRTAAHNRHVGGGKRSMHLFGHAFDVSLANGKQTGEPGFMIYDGEELERLARKYGFNGIGRYPTNLEAGHRGFIHMDMRNRAATWDGVKGKKGW